MLPLDRFWHTLGLHQLRISSSMKIEIAPLPFGRTVVAIPLFVRLEENHKLQYNTHNSINSTKNT